MSPTRHLRHPFRDRMPDRDLDAILRGELDGDTGAAALANLCAQLIVTLGSEPAPAPSTSLLAVFEHGRAALGADVRPTRLPRPAAKRPTRTSRWTNARARVAVAAIVGILTTGSLAVADALPSVVQRPLSDAASHLGIHLPGGHDPEPGPVSPHKPGAPTSATTRPPAPEGSTQPRSDLAGAVGSAPSSNPVTSLPPVTTPTVPQPSLPVPSLFPPGLPLPSVPPVTVPIVPTTSPGPAPH